jgi:hypothetical protein
MNAIRPPDGENGRTLVTIDERVLNAICEWAIDLAQRLNALDDRVVALEDERKTERPAREKLPA